MAKPDLLMPPYDSSIAKLFANGLVEVTQPTTRDGLVLFDMEPRLTIDEIEAADIYKDENPMEFPIIYDCEGLLEVLGAGELADHERMGADIYYGPGYEKLNPRLIKDPFVLLEV